MDFEGRLKVEETRRDEAVRVARGPGLLEGALGRSWRFERGSILTILEWMEKGGEFIMGGKDSSMGVALEIGRGGVYQKPRAENLCFVRRQGR